MSNRQKDIPMRSIEGAQMPGRLTSIDVLDESPLLLFRDEILVQILTWQLVVGCRLHALENV